MNAKNHLLLFIGKTRQFHNREKKKNAICHTKLLKQIFGILNEINDFCAINLEQKNKIPIQKFPSEFHTKKKWAHSIELQNGSHFLGLLIFAMFDKLLMSYAVNFCNNVRIGKQNKCSKGWVSMHTLFAPFK